MRIIHFEDEPWDSGIAHYAATLAAEQSRRGHRVEFWGREGSPALKDASARGVAARGWPAGAGSWLSLTAMRARLSAFAPDIINAHTGSSHLLVLAAAPRASAVVRTRGDIRVPGGGPLARLAAGRTAAFIAANSSIQRHLQGAFPGARVRLVPQGIPGPKAAVPMPAAARLGIIARLDPVKGHDVLFDAALRLKSECPGLKILCAGEGALLEPLRRGLRSRHLEAMVDLLGRVPDKWDFLAGCRVGVVASTGSEAVSRAALEWMAAGRPLVASRVGGLPDLVEDGVTGLLVEPGDARAMAEALKTLLADATGTCAMGARARERWEKEFAPEPFYQSTQKVYDETINSFPR